MEVILLNDIFRTYGTLSDLIEIEYYNGLKLFSLILPLSLDLSPGSEAQSHSRKCYIYLNLYFYFFALVSRPMAVLIRNALAIGVSLHQVRSVYPAVCGIHSETTLL